MKLSVSTLACPNWSFPEIVGAAAAHGIQGIDARGIGPEIDVTRLDLFDAELDATLELLGRHDLKISCYNTSVALVTPAPERWEMMLDEYRRHALLAQRTGCPFVRVFGGAVPKGMSPGEAMVMARRHLRQLVKMSAPHGCQVLLETHDDWSHSDRVLDLIGDAAPGEVGVLWDIEHPYRGGESPAQTAGALARYIGHIHFKDSIRSNGKSIPCLIGEGDLPLSETVSALRQIGYDRYICLEVEKRWHPHEAPEPEQSLPRFARWMAEHWPA